MNRYGNRLGTRRSTDVKNGERRAQLSVNAGPDGEWVAGEYQLAAQAPRGGRAPYTGLWTIVGGGTGTFDDDEAENAVFAADDDTDVITLRWTVTDAAGAVASDTVRICPPLVTSAGADDDGTVGEPFSLLGSATGGVPPYVYAWVKTSGDGNAVILDASDATTTVTCDEADDYVMTLTATDARGVGDSDSMTLTIEEEVVGDPFVLYPAFDRSVVPWHTGAGAWGAQCALQEPTLPTITRSVSVDNINDFNTEAAVAGTQITVTASLSGVAGINANDVRVIINDGVKVEILEPSNIARLHVRGQVAGQHNTGMFGLFKTSGTCTDIVLEGLDSDGDSTFFGAGWQHRCFHMGDHLGGIATRVACLYLRCIAGGYVWLGAARHVLIAACNWYGGGMTRDDAGYVEGWTFRAHEGPITIVDSIFASTRYHQIRPAAQDDTGDELLYCGRSKLIALAEGKAVWAWNNLGLSEGVGEGFILEDSEIYSYADAGCPSSYEISVTDCAYSRVRNNDFFGGGTAVYSQAILNSAAGDGGGDPGDHDWTVGNTFTALGALPAWGSTGDPTAIARPGGGSWIAGEDVCPGYEE